MPEPLIARDIAERNLAAANVTVSGEDAMTIAAIGIGYALLALADAVEYSVAHLVVALSHPPVDDDDDAGAVAQDRQVRRRHQQ